MNRITITIVAAFGVILASTAHASLVQTFFDDFSGDLSQWGQGHLAGGNISINGSQQMVVDADQNDPRGFLYTNYSTDSAGNLAALVNPNEVFMRISFDVISGSTHGGELLVGVVPGSGADNVNGTHTLSPLADPAGGGRGHGHGTYPNSPNFGPVNSGLNGTSLQSPVGKNVRLDWVKRLTGEGTEATDRVEVYYNGVEEFRFDEIPNNGRLDFQAGPAGFYILLNRDFTIDNFTIMEAVPEPSALALLGLGGLVLGLARRRARR